MVVALLDSSAIEIHMSFYVRWSGVNCLLCLKKSNKKMVATERLNIGLFWTLALSKTVCLYGKKYEMLTDNREVHPMADRRSCAHLALVDTGIAALREPYLQEKAKIVLLIFITPCTRNGGFFCF